jgi:peptidoglycan/xylan/chitin deacetylase (PgdA/CDA1 family)
MPAEGKNIYLTFDDGPVPEVTPWVLETLSHYNAKATFFCVGSNVLKYPEIFHSVKENGHAVGVHTMTHVNGWKVSDEKYLSEVNECAGITGSKLFRPPYGRITMSQIKKLRNNFSIVMWDVLSRDYDATMSGEKCFMHVKNNASPGSIIVFHDSLKAEERLRKALPETLKFFSGEGFEFKKLYHAQ